LLEVGMVAEKIALKRATGRTSSMEYGTSMAAGTFSLNNNSAGAPIKSKEMISQRDESP